MADRRGCINFVSVLRMHPPTTSHPQGETWHWPLVSTSRSVINAYQTAPPPPAPPPTPTHRLPPSLLPPSTHTCSVKHKHDCMLMRSAAEYITGNGRRGGGDGSTDGEGGWGGRGGGARGVDQTELKVKMCPSGEGMADRRGCIDFVSVLLMHPPTTSHPQGETWHWPLVSTSRSVMDVCVCGRPHPITATDLITAASPAQASSACANKSALDVYWVEDCRPAGNHCWIGSANTSLQAATI